MFNPERDDYDALDASRSVLSGSTKLMVNIHQLRLYPSSAE